MAKITTRQVKKVPNPTGKGGFGENPQNINPGGEPKNSLKNYVASKLAEMSNEEKEKWLEKHKIDGKTQWTMAEGNPDSNVKDDITITSKVISVDE